MNTTHKKILVALDTTPRALSWVIAEPGNRAYGLYTHTAQGPEKVYEDAIARPVLNALEKAGYIAYGYSGQIPEPVKGRYGVSVTLTERGKNALLAS